MTLPSKICYPLFMKRNTKIKIFEDSSARQVLKLSHQAKSVVFQHSDVYTVGDVFGLLDDPNVNLPKGVRQELTDMRSRFIVRKADQRREPEKTGNKLLSDAQVKQIKDNIQRRGIEADMAAAREIIARWDADEALYQGK